MSFSASLRLALLCAVALSAGPGGKGHCGDPPAAASPTPDSSTPKPIMSTMVRTTAYTHTEADHLRYGIKTALGTDLRYTPEYHSVAADWSRFPLGTKFKIRGYDRLFVVDDYGKGLVGSMTIDVYFNTVKGMNNWGVRHVMIDVLEFGSFVESRKILAVRANYPHCRQMLASMTPDDWFEKYGR
ncbi:MAG TPA: 3D domain-containing protein [Verrucomicrobiales bacterium]|nr:3D domain-containing protein [Verrucomicrobiae bacterium]MCP5552339.1 3D domain-containing protein [Akkermansiaceae bacterium]HRX56243.1 3D domain-containing protein [Verrucomicrobiales bacterium]